MNPVPYLHLFASNLCSAGQIYSEADQTCYSTDIPQVGASNSEIQTILQAFFIILAALAVLFIVIGGLRYVISGGDPEDMKKAKNTIIYALVGLIVCIVAEALVTFVITFIK